MIADQLVGRDFALAAALGAFLGHLFPAWLEFRGGKGVATFLGILLGLYWPAAAGFAAIWLAVAAITRYSSLSALVASALYPFILYGIGLPVSAILTAVLAVLLWIKHADNIQRLFAGTEGRIGEKSGG